MSGTITKGEAITALVAARRRELEGTYPGDLLGEYRRLVDATTTDLIDGEAVYSHHSAEDGSAA